MTRTGTKTVVVIGIATLALAVGGVWGTKAIIRARQKALVARRQAEYKRLLTQVWPDERETEIERIRQRQQSNETVNAKTIDLSPYINTKLTEAPLGWKGNNSDNLAELPRGEHVYAGVPFDVDGSIQLMGDWIKHYHKKYPYEMDGIRVGRNCAKIHLLHGNGFIVETNFGTVVAKMVLHYVDGTTNVFDLVAGKHSFDWWCPLFKSRLPDSYLQNAPETERAWTGSNAYIRKWQPELSLVLYKTTFENPKPELEIASVDFVSTGTITCPFLVGLTVE